MNTTLKSMIRRAPEGTVFSDQQLLALADEALTGLSDDVRRVLLLPPDLTRKHSRAGFLAEHIYHQLTSRGCEVWLLPALGSHLAMTEEECADMFGTVPFDRILHHDWRNAVVSVGAVPAEEVFRITEGYMNEPVEVELNRTLTEGGWDSILSIGQVVPHEVVGMANYTKNLVVGCGGPSFIGASHLIGAVYGLERLMGRDHGPVRDLFDYAQDNVLTCLPLSYILTVNDGGVIGFYTGTDRNCFNPAVQHSMDKNVTLLDEPCQTILVNLQEDEFRSTWVGSKAVHRTRMALADGGNLIILAPGIDRFGEDDDNDVLIRRYGYTGRDHILELAATHPDLAANRSATAHLVQTSSNGRFTITYCTKHLTKEEVEGAGLEYVPYEEALERFHPEALKPGMNDNGIFYVPNPGVGLWAWRESFLNPRV